MRRILLLVIGTAIAASPALAATDPHLEASLKADMVKTFKKKAPTLKFTKVKCVLPESGATAHCKAYFIVSGTNGYYPVTAKLHDLGGTLTWTAQSPKCLNAKTKTYIAC
jgi:hypothetical protein